MSRLGSLALALVLAAAIGCHDFGLDFDREAGDIDVPDDLFSISIVDEKHAVAVGYYGAAYYTEDGGDTWEKGRTGTRLSIYGVAMADATYGWAAGQRGLMLRTEDGGRTWTEQSNPKEKEGSHFFSIAAIDKDNAVAVGEWGTRIRTTDGGKSWEDYSFTVDEQHPQFVWLAPIEKEKVRSGQKVFEDVTLTDVACLRAPSQSCWLIGEFGYIFYSDDGGVTWHKSMIEGTVEMDPVTMAYNEIDVSDAEQERIEEFGETVATEYHLNVAIEAVASPDEVQRMGRSEDPTVLFEVLEARTQEVISIFENQGISTDRLRRRGQPPWDYEDFLEDDPDFLNRFLARQTSEKPGVKVRVIQNPYLFKVRFRDQDNGLIAGLGGVILRSSDGGRTWAYRKTARQQALFSAAAVEGRAVAVGEKGFIVFSTDDGDTWHDAPEDAFPPVFTFMRDVSFERSGRVGLIVGQQGRIYRSTDAGYKWETVLSPKILRDRKLAAEAAAG